MSNDALSVRARVLGEEALQFYDYLHPESGTLPLTLAQAMQINDRIAQLDSADPDRPNPQDEIGVYVDLESIDTSAWEHPQLDRRGDQLI